MLTRSATRGLHVDPGTRVANARLGRYVRLGTFAAGGHRGIASVLDAFQTDAIRRVKVGIGRPGGVGNAADYVLRPFEEADRVLVEQACKTAVERILHLATAQEGQKPEPKRKFAHEVQDGASRA